MTFEEALESKKEFGEKINENGVIMKVIITPDNNTDFNKFLNDYRSKKISDNDAKRYSKDGKFIICALAIIGSDVIYKILVP